MAGDLERGTVPARLAAAVEQARAAAVDVADGDASQVGEHLEVRAEDVHEAATHYFAAAKPGYRGWTWAVTVASSGDPDAEPGPAGSGPAGSGPAGSGPADDPSIGVSEVVLLPGPDSLVAPAWVPWHDRVRAEDLGPGDLLPVEDDDERLVPSHAVDDSADDAETDTTSPLEDPQVKAVGDELGLGRPRVMSREGRLDAALRWSDGDFGPGADMARATQAHCGTCGFFLPVSGSLRAAFGVCGNGNVPADGHVVHVEYGCGGHSELQVDTGAVIAVAELVYDDGVEMDPTSEPRPAVAGSGG